MAPGTLITVGIAAADPTQLARLRAFLLQDPYIRLVAAAATRAALPGVLNWEPDVLVLSADLDPAATPAVLIKQVLGACPGTQILLIAEGLHPTDIERAAVAGARGILGVPLTATELVDTIREIHETVVARRQRVADLAHLHRRKVQRGLVIVVFSPKGGVGCSVLACNLAVALYQATQKRVALVDYSLQFGTVGSLLNIRSPHHIGELARNYDEIDKTILNSVLVPHESGIKVLLPPPALDQVDQFTTESLIGILEGVRRQFDYVVVDTWHAIEDATLAVLELADTLLLVTTPERPALASTRHFLAALKSYPHLQHKPQLVVNRYPSRGGVGLAVIQQELGLTPLALVPSDGQAILTAINHGVSLLEKKTPGG